MKCKWEYDDMHDYYDTECDEAFTCIEGDLKDNKIKFCPFCGKEINEVKTYGYIRNNKLHNNQFLRMGIVLFFRLL